MIFGPHIGDNAFAIKEAIERAVPSAGDQRDGIRCGVG